MAGNPTAQRSPEKLLSCCEQKNRPPCEVDGLKGCLALLIGVRRGVVVYCAQGCEEGGVEKHGPVFLSTIYNSHHPANARYFSRPGSRVG